MFPCSLSFLPFLFSVCSGKNHLFKQFFCLEGFTFKQIEIKDDSANVARQQARDFPCKETAGKSKTHGYNFFVYIFRYKKAISKMSEILEGPVERIIVETKEAPAPVGPYSQVGGNLKRKYPEIEEATFVTIGEV
jgi:hypothetical protein